MFANLIESQSHGKEFKRRGRFVIATAVAYTVLFFVAGIVSVLAYDARLEAQTNDLEILNWVPPVDRVIADPARPTRPVRRPAQSNAPVDPNIRVAERSQIIPPQDPRSTPEIIGVGPVAPPVIGEVKLTGRNVNPPGLPAGPGTDCIACSETGPPRVVVDTTPPPTPIVVKPPTQRVTSIVLASKAISLPQPPYPPLAKQTGVHGAVQVQILVDETGRVISAHAVSGHPFLNPSAEQAAQRARFTPTTLNGQAVKVQGVIVYNFVLQ